MTPLFQGLARHCRPEELRALQIARVGIIGAGGLGSNVAMLLARSGVGGFTIVDPDIVEPSNLNRQAYFPPDVGQAKVRALARHLYAVNPTVRLVVHQEYVTPENALSLFSQCPIVVECVDDADLKGRLYGIFRRETSLYVTASGMAGHGSTLAMEVRRLAANVVAVGDFTRPVDAAHPPLAPRVMQAAALEADAVLHYLLHSL